MERDIRASGSVGTIRVNRDYIAVKDATDDSPARLNPHSLLLRCVDNVGIISVGRDSMRAVQRNPHQKVTIIVEIHVN